MPTRVRFVIAVFAYLLTAPAWGQSLSISPNQFYVFDVENFIKVFGPTLGTESTVITYTNGNTVLGVNPQVDPDAPFLSDVWVPIEVSITVGSWEVRVVATDLGGTQRVYGPATLEILERPQSELPPTLPEALLFEASSSGGELVFTP